MLLEVLIRILCNYSCSSVLYCEDLKCRRSPLPHYLVLGNNVADIMLSKASMHLDIFGRTCTLHSAECMGAFSKSPTPNAQEQRSVCLHIVCRICVCLETISLRFHLLFPQCCSVFHDEKPLAGLIFSLHIELHFKGVSCSDGCF